MARARVINCAAVQLERPRFVLADQPDNYNQAHGATSRGLPRRRRLAAQTVVALTQTGHHLRPVPQVQICHSLHTLVCLGLGKVEGKATDPLKICVQLVVPGTDYAVALIHRFAWAETASARGIKADTFKPRVALLAGIEGDVCRLCVCLNPKTQKVGQIVNHNCVIGRSGKVSFSLFVHCTASRIRYLRWRIRKSV